MTPCYETVSVVGNVESAVNVAVAGYQANHGGDLPQYVWVPRGKMPAHGVVQHWAMRRVAVVEGRHSGWEVRAT